MTLKNKKFKKTLYFTASSHSTDQMKLAIESVTLQRDEFIETNKDFIAKIDNEEIILKTWNNDHYVVPILKLTYYEV